ncbi:MEKHLA domain-containing protein [Xanthomonas populi]|uniref:MEKHLA domain-containing protein n=1 Tax=Xanthomonas populi TaxID=53414 RepID=A0A2S7ELS1_9XANT|nr:MEKHLA domain-containing protein [Xanthomonas populi]PPU91153.1 MEKHLA domain-containing protein [Xanthomonas populi]
MRHKDDSAFFALLTGSFFRVVGRPLVAHPGIGADWLYTQAPFALLAHDTRPDPVFGYANRAAQRAFGYGWEEFIGMPSRLSAELLDRPERQRLLDAVARNGFVTGYAGIRIAKDGARFPIADGVVWQLIDDAGALRGQAAAFPLSADGTYAV